MLLIYHGMEIFDPELMSGGGMFKGAYAKVMVYAAKAAESTSGVLLVLGLLTRVSALLIVGTFAYITFFVGQGRFWYEEQHPFMFAS